MPPPLVGAHCSGQDVCKAVGLRPGYMLPPPPGARGDVQLVDLRLVDPRGAPGTSSTVAPPHSSLQEARSGPFQTPREVTATCNRCSKGETMRQRFGRFVSPLRLPFLVAVLVLAAMASLPADS